MTEEIIDLKKRRGRSELLNAWKLWDRRPADPTYANRMCDADVAYADELGTTHTTLRTELGNLRRQGMSREEALATFERSLKPPAKAPDTTAHGDDHSAAS